MDSPQHAYRQIPDQGAKVAEYRFYWIVGKLLVLLSVFISTPFVFGLNQAHGFSLWWLFALPVSLLICLFRKGFPAFSRCPACAKRMVPQSKQGKARKSHGGSNGVGLTRRYLVCHGCMLYMFLGETGDGD
jgi:hypothetical protein